MLIKLSLMFELSPYRVDFGFLSPSKNKLQQILPGLLKTLLVFYDGEYRNGAYNAECAEPLGKTERYIQPENGY